MTVSRFAPSTTGEAHPGTLLSALLVWLDARASGGQALLRLEDLDHTRCRAEWQAQLVDDLAWLGLDWDQVIVQSQRRADHEAALDRLAAAGRLYPCTCSRRDRAGGRRAPDGGWAYDNRCRDRPLPPDGWRAPGAVVRARLDDGWLALTDDSGLDLSQDPARDMGDPIVVRRDGVIAYQLAVVVDDAAAGIDRVVRGRDIAPSTATQVRLQEALGLPRPRYPPSPAAPRRARRQAGQAPRLDPGVAPARALRRAGPVRVAGLGGRPDPDVGAGRGARAGRRLRVVEGGRRRSPGRVARW
jgi:glutamyl-Q tRNA(Asp) synthetase